MLKFSVAVSVYKNDNPEYFDRALKSITIDQTLQPNEIVLVVDGPVSIQILDVIKKYEELTGYFNVIYFENNKGLGNALRVAVENSKYELIARMDADDISMPNRFEQQIKYFESHKDIDIVGGDITEFIDSEDNVIAKRIVPKNDKEIKEYLKIRCPFNHVSVMYKKKAVLDVGGYLDWYCNEDYYLWIRMYLANINMANTGTILVNVRVGKDMYSRRGGNKYYQSEIDIQKLMLKEGIIDKKIYISNCLKRFIVEKVLPNNLRGIVFKIFARD